MFKELINSLTFMYAFSARSRGKLDKSDLEGIRRGAHAMAVNAGTVLADKDIEFTAEQKNDLAEAQLIYEHIDEMVDWLIRLEII